MTITKRIAKGSPLTYEQLDANFDELLTAIEQKANADLSNVSTLPAGVVAQLKGAKGDVGDAGAMGDAGASGVDGATWLFGSDAPQSDAGSMGDLYLDCASWNVYAKIEGSWSLLGNLSGATANAANSSSGSAQFSGAQYLTITDNKITFAANEDFTIEVFVYRTANTTIYDGIFSLCGGGTGWNSGGNGFVLCAGSFHVSPNGAMNYTASIPLNTWTHIAAARKAGVIRIFMNGAQVATVNNTSELGTGAGKPMLGMFDSNRYGFTGNMTNLRVIGGTGLYDTAFTPPNAPLGIVSGTKLLMRMSTQETMTKDYSPQNSSITNGGATFSPLDPFGL